MSDDNFRTLGDVVGKIVDHVTCIAICIGAGRSTWPDSGSPAPRGSMVCGQIVGSALAHAAVPDKENCKPIDQELRDRPWQERRKLWTEQAAAALERDEAQSQEWWDRYNEYLATPEWAARRAAVLKRAAGVCEGCGANRASQVHHLTYKHVRNEFLWELVAICNQCHERCHPGNG